MKLTPTYWLTRFVFLRLLGLVYLVAFLVVVNQGLPLFGGHGLLPAKDFLARYGSQFESHWAAFRSLPSIFWMNSSDTTLMVFAWIGVLLSFLLVIGFANVPLLLALWMIYMSFVNIGQVWYSYGWEIQLLETGFLAIFLVPLVEARPFPRLPPSNLVIWTIRWLAFRINLGAGLIKIRGDSCWRNLTCLFYHYETQPIPNPLSPFLHFLPQLFHKFEVLITHFVQLIVPFFIFTTQQLRNIAGAILLVFQLILITTGNYSFLNWITIVAIVSCFDDSLLQRVLPRTIVQRAEKASKQAKPSKIHNRVCWVLVIIVALLSIPVVLNLISSQQIMNTSFEPLHLVNTYGAFGSIGKERYELIVEGTDDSVVTNSTVWKEYEFKAKPGNPSRGLPIVAPYHYRLDWQMWFAAMESPEDNPWLIHLIWKFLHNDEGAFSLIANNPFPDNPPTYIRVEYYRYHFNPPGSKDVWRREYVGAWLPPMSADTLEPIISRVWKD